MPIQRNGHEDGSIFVDADGPALRAASRRSHCTQSWTPVDKRSTVVGLLLTTLGVGGRAAAVSRP